MSATTPAAARECEAERRGWLAVTSLALGSFALVLSEFLPIGLLPALAADFGVGVGTAGLLVVTTGLAAAVSAPVLTVLTSRTDRRTVLLWLTGLVVAANAVGALTEDFAVLLGARLLLGVSAGGFWAIGAGLAVRLVPSGSIVRATSLITAGISVATVLSLPLGSLVSSLSSWRTAFVIGAGVALAALLAQIALLPSLPAGDPVRVSTLRGLLSAPAARTVLAVSALVFTAQFAAYTYVAAYLEDVVGAGPSATTAGLLILGVAGVVGNAVAGLTLGRSLRTTVGVVLALLVVVVVALPLLASSAPSVVVLLVVWGLVWGALPLGTQTWMLRASPTATEGSLALFVTVVQLAIAGGSVAGGIAVGAVGLEAGFFLAGGVAAIGLVVFLVAGSRARHSDREPAGLSHR